MAVDRSSSDDNAMQCTSGFMYDVMFAHNGSYSLHKVPHQEGRIGDEVIYDCLFVDETCLLV